MRNLNNLLALAFTAFMISCGAKEEKKKGFEYQDTPETPVETKAMEKADQNVTEITITGNDMMKFNLTEIRVKAGQKVKLTLTHVGKLDKKVMGHNFVIVVPGTDMSAFAMEAATAADNDYIPADTDKVIVHTKLLGGGESDTIEFDAPAQGTYDFLCSFPGHFAMMNGKFIVE